MYQYFVAFSEFLTLRPQKTWKMSTSNQQTAVIDEHMVTTIVENVMGTLQSQIQETVQAATEVVVSKQVIDNLKTNWKLEGNREEYHLRRKVTRNNIMQTPKLLINWMMHWINWIETTSTQVGSL